MANLDFYTYIHKRNDSGLVFYIGKGSSKRAWSKNNRNRHWHNIVNKVGYSVEITQWFDNEKAALDKEREMIARYRSEGHVLANICDGGEANSGKRHTEESKEKLRKAHTGRKLSKDQIEKQRKALIGLVKSESHRKAISIARIGMKIPSRWKGVCCIDTNIYYESLSAAADQTGLDISHIVKCCKGKLAHIKGFTFVYA